MKGHNPLFQKANPYKPNTKEYKLFDIQKLEGCQKCGQYYETVEEHFTHKCQGATVQ
jgi:hypothetical protein